MKKPKKHKLEKAGGKVAGIEEFLGLSAEEASLIEIKRTLVNQLSETRRANKITQAQLAKMINSSQSRVAKMEAGSLDVTLDLLLKGLFALGATPKQIARAIART